MNSTYIFCIKIIVKANTIATMDIPKRTYNNRLGRLRIEFFEEKVDE